MRKWLLICILLVPLGALAQSPSSTGNITDTGSTCATTNACISLILPTQTAAASTAGVVVSGTWSATLSFEASADNVNWAAINALPLTGGSAVTSTTANGTWQIGVAGMIGVRVRCSAFTSGKAVVTISATASAAVSSAASVVNLFAACSGTQYLGADGACHTGGGGGSLTPTGSPASSYVTYWTAPTTLTGTANATLDSSGNLLIAGTLTGTAAGGFSGTFTEGTCAMGVSGKDIFCADSTAHQLEMNNNNGGEIPIVGGPASSTNNDCAKFSGTSGSILADFGSPCGGLTSTGSPVNTDLTSWSAANTLTGTANATLDTSGNEIANSLSAKGNPTFNAGAYGCVADNGTTDNTTCYNSMLTAIGTTGGTILFPFTGSASATYDFNTAPNISSNNNVQITSEPGVILKRNYHGNLFAFTGNQSGLHDVILDGGSETGNANDGQLAAFSGNSNVFSNVLLQNTGLTSAGAMRTATLGAAGSNYSAATGGDTGTILCTVLNPSAINPTYSVATVSGSGVATFSITNGGSGCPVANGVTTATGGSQPGSGSGFTVNITVVMGGTVMVANSSNRFSSDNVEFLGTQTDTALAIAASGGTIKDSRITRFTIDQFTPATALGGIDAEDFIPQANAIKGSFSGVTVDNWKIFYSGNASNSAAIKMQGQSISNSANNSRHQTVTNGYCYITGAANNCVKLYSFMESIFTNNYGDDQGNALSLMWNFGDTYQSTIANNTSKATSASTLNIFQITDGASNSVTGNTINGVPGNTSAGMVFQATSAIMSDNTITGNTVVLTSAKTGECYQFLSGSASFAMGQNEFSGNTCLAGATATNQTGVQITTSVANGGTIRGLNFDNNICDGVPTCFILGTTSTQTFHQQTSSTLTVAGLKFNGNHCYSSAAQTCINIVPAASSGGAVTVTGVMAVGNEQNSGNAGSIFYTSTPGASNTITSSYIGQNNIFGTAETTPITLGGTTERAFTHTVTGTCTLGTNCAVTFAGPDVFTGTTTYACQATDTTAAAATRVSQSGNVATFTGTGTDVLQYTCNGY